MTTSDRDTILSLLGTALAKGLHAHKDTLKTTGDMGLLLVSVLHHCGAVVHFTEAGLTLRVGPEPVGGAELPAVNTATPKKGGMLH